MSETIRMIQKKTNHSEELTATWGNKMELSSFFKITLLSLAVILSQTACSIISGGEDDTGSKNFSIKYSKPQNPFEIVSGSTADAVWQSKETGNTIAVNSLCRKYQEISLDKLKTNMLSGIENLKIEKSTSVFFNEREAERVTAHGTTDGIAVSISLLILKKNNCTYDLAYISRASLFEKEIKIFEKFIEGFKVP